MMLTGLDILLDRMKTNPEEFLEEGRHVPYEGQQFGGKWADLVTYAWRVSTEEERKMLEDAQRQFYRDNFNERVMKRLAGEEVKQEVSPYIVKSNPVQASSHWTDPRMQNAVLQGNGSGGFGQAQTKQEGEPVGGMGNGFWGGIVSSGKGKLW
jgi:hypothetical protein